MIAAMPCQGQLVHLISSNSAYVIRNILKVGNGHTGNANGVLSNNVN